MLKPYLSSMQDNLKLNSNPMFGTGHSGAGGSTTAPSPSGFPGGGMPGGFPGGFPGGLPAGFSGGFPGGFPGLGGGAAQSQGDPFKPKTVV